MNGTEVNLDTLFRRSSKARVVAERLMSGKPLSRAQLVDGLDLSLTTVPRVVEALEGAGVKIERTTDRTRQAVFRVVNAALPETQDTVLGGVIARYVHTAGDPVRVAIEKVEVVEGQVWVEWTCARFKQRWRGRLVDSDAGGVTLPTSLLRGEAEIVALSIFESGQLGVRIGDDKSSVLIAEQRKI